MGSLGHAASVRLRHAVLAGILAAVAAPLDAAVLHVAPGDSIQAALDRAAAGDQVLVAAGTFLGDLDFRGKAVHLRGAGPQTVIRGSGRGPVVRFVRGEGRATVLDSVTVTGGRAERGGGLYVRNSSPTVVRTVIRDNRATASGAGIHLQRSAARLYNNLVVRNVRAGDGDPHAVEIVDASPLLVNNTIAHGDSNGVLVRGASYPLLLANLVAFNGSRPAGAPPRGRGICDFGPATVLQWNLWFGNRVAAILTGGVDYATAAAAERALAVKRLADNVDGAPRFVDAAAGDYRLRPRSAARRAGPPGRAYRNRDGSRNTIGHLGGPFAAPSTALP